MSYDRGTQGEHGAVMQRLSDGQAEMLAEELARREALVAEAPDVPHVELDEQGGALLTPDEIAALEGAQITDGRKLKQVTVIGQDGRPRREFLLTNRAERRQLDNSRRLPGDLQKKKKPRKSKSR